MICAQCAWRATAELTEPTRPPVNSPSPRAADHDHRRTLGPRDERRGSVLMRQLGADLDRSDGVPCLGDFDGCGALMLCPGLQLLSMTRARHPCRGN